jgi:hypothetical protein
MTLEARLRFWNEARGRSCRLRRPVTQYLGHPFFPQRFAAEALAALQVSQR